MRNAIESQNESQSFAFSYVVLAAGLSSLLLALWRWYARYLDNHIVKLYPEIMLYEHVLGVPPDSGITGYLDRKIRDLLLGLYQNQRPQVVRQLVKDRHIGRRGHLPFDIFVIILIIVFFVIVLLFDLYNLYLLGKLSSLICFAQLLVYPMLALKWVGYLLIVSGLVLWCWVFCYYQKEPSGKYIDDVKRKFSVQTGT